jgi:hypothetical protein
LQELNLHLSSGNGSVRGLIPYNAQQKFSAVVPYKPLRPGFLAERQKLELYRVQHHRVNILFSDEAVFMETVR